MSIFGLPLLLFKIVSGREWYQDGDQSVTKEGVIDNIVNVGSGNVETNTQIVTPTGIIDDTEDV